MGEAPNCLPGILPPLRLPLLAVSDLAIPRFHLLSPHRQRRGKARLSITTLPLTDNQLSSLFGYMHPFHTKFCL